MNFLKKVDNVTLSLFIKLFAEVIFDFKFFKKNLSLFVNFFSNSYKLLNFYFKNVFIFFNSLMRLFIASNLYYKLIIIIKVIEVIIIVHFYYLRYQIIFLLMCARARVRLNIKS